MNKAARRNLERSKAGAVGRGQLWQAEQSRVAACLAAWPLTAGGKKKQQQFDCELPPVSERGCKSDSDSGSSSFSLGPPCRAPLSIQLAPPLSPFVAPVRLAALTLIGFWLVG